MNLHSNYHSNIDEFSANAFHYTRNFSPSPSPSPSGSGTQLGTGGGIGVTKDDYLGPETKGKVTTTILFTGSGSGSGSGTGIGSCSYYLPGCYDCGDGYDTGKYDDCDGLFSGLADGVDDYDQFASLGRAFAFGGGVGAIC
ncbi:unnamed protein product [Ambrosiozyma monospora]|uniref:Unnamed protein product n=1 Tax=Ambrosiozyma monospora TaxID=43982 RepID=A0A9W6WMP2_AMBMO|nr:unnamed protein product [Ambrosiozyma monospora]